MRNTSARRSTLAQKNVKAHRQPLGDTTSESSDNTSEYESPSTQADRTNYMAESTPTTRARQNRSVSDRRVPEQSTPTTRNRNNQATPRAGAHRSAANASSSEAEEPPPARRSKTTSRRTAAEAPPARRQASPERRPAGRGGTRRRKQAAPQRAPWLREIRFLQSTVHLLIPKLPFARLVRELLLATTISDIRITREALEALHNISEIYLTYMFEDANRLALHAKRVTLQCKDIQLVMLLRKNFGVT